jgi:hypothetical protein
VLAFAMLVPMARPATAAPGAAICAVGGTVNLTVGVASFPPGEDRPGAAYSYAGVGVVCAGTLTGVSLSSQSSGVFGVPECGSWAGADGRPSPSPVYSGTDQRGIGPFCGSYDSGVFNVTNNSCAGTVGGPEGLPPNPGMPWSANFGTFVNGDISCAQGALPTGLGVITLQASVVPTSSNLLGGSCDPPLPSTFLSSIGVNLGSTDDAVDHPLIWYCQIAIAGVTVTAQS